MKQGNNNRRGRGRGPRKPHGMGGQHGGGMSKGAQTYDSNGPDIRVRGNAHQVLEKYLQMARDAGVIGDRIAAENYLQHAEHYYRMIAAQTEGQRPRVGGRELSVAEVNVQNVSQGLSAALYAAPGGAGLPGEGPPAAGDQPGAAPSQQAGNYAEEDDEPDQFNSYQGRGGREQGQRDHGGSENRQHDSRNNDNRGEGRSGPRRHQRGPNRHDGQRHDGQRQDGPRQDFQRQDGHRNDGRQGDGQAVDGNRFNESRPDIEPKPIVVNRAPARDPGEQPDYPSELLAQPIVPQPAVTLPETQPSLALAPATEGQAPSDAEATPIRRGRGRPRGTAAPRRPRSAANAEGEAPATEPVEIGD